MLIWNWPSTTKSWWFFVRNRNITKENDSLMGNVEEFRWWDNKQYHEFIGLSTQHIDVLKERLEPMKQWVFYLYKIQDQSDKLIESLW